MALRAVGREGCQRVIGICHPGVIAMMAGIALSRRPCVPTRMALRACGRPMCSSQREVGQIVVKRRRLPARRRMALLAVSRESGCDVIGVGRRRVVCVVACIALHWSAGIS